MEYETIKNVPKERYYEIFIQADYHDADYCSSTTKCSQEEFDEVFPKLVELKYNYGGRHQLEDFCDDTYLLDMPHSRYSDCHSLDELKVTMYDVDGYNYEIKF